ncbi:MULTISPECIES: DNA polymerase III subunit delta [unclassified Methylophilus]|uniref:DNA polymerase III subunit delta n=1 Tax=unclassified Methylophilus TaxID=2630143 RepID=UPI000701A5F7|nr:MULTISPECIES: DNA polymerase III subunit delta [unclassified Methylophilus]KQT34076.1 DNA polymerase III subunit delta [Methylophilus sp. Leaf414]KQT41694.1 DNA polymerase III subunit delta [Methylophilus sp. Leaf416]KQT55861.1 DNA polymerase III subunit delta [Methylophilus sp. Leaf459]
MRIQAAQLAQHLPPKQHLYVLAGDEPLSITESIDKIRAAARQHGAQERASFTVERYFNWGQVSQFLQSFSLFAEQRILEINIPTGKPGVEGGKALQELAGLPAADTTIIITLPAPDRDMTNSAWYEALLQQGVVLIHNQVPLAQLPDWIGQRLALQQQTADEVSRRFIAEQVEGNLLAAHQEIQKLGLLYPAGALTEEAIRQCVLNVARFDVSQLGEAMLHGDQSRILRIIEGLREEGETAVTVMNPLVWLFRPLLQVRLAMQSGQSMQNALTQARLFGDRQQLVKRALEFLPQKHIEAALQKLSDIDRIAKGVGDGDAWLELSRLCTGIARMAASKSARAGATRTR